MYFKPLKLKENAPDFLWLHEGGYALGVPEQAEKIAKMKNHAKELGIRDETVQYVENLRKAGVPVDFEIYRGCYHAFEQVCPKAEVSKKAITFITNSFKHAIEHHFAEQNIIIEYIKGGRTVAKLVNFQINELPQMRIIGKAIYPNPKMEGNAIPAFWGQCFKEGTFDILDRMNEYHIDSSYVGWMGDWNNDGSFTYLCGMLMKPDTPVPGGFVYRDVPASTTAVGWIQGPEKDTYPVAHELTQKALQEQGYVTDEDVPWCMELYNCPRFTQPMENGDIILDYYIPCKTAGGEK